jgi:hypothetical protein
VWPVLLFIKHVDPRKEELPAQASTLTKGSVTSTMVRVIEDPADLDKGSWLNATSFYDDKGRIIQTQADNYKGGYDINTNLYDFSGKVLSNYLVHKNPAAGGTEIKVQTLMEYDHAGRVLSIKKKINDQEDAHEIVKNEYDAVGRLKKKHLGHKAGELGSSLPEPLETLEHSYNIRGWLQGINKDYANGLSPTGGAGGGAWFGMELNYDWGFGTAQFNGNIAGTKWRSKGDDQRRAYGFMYDKVNRLMSGDFSQYAGSSYADNSIVNYDMLMGDGINASSAYDANGNIKAMKQWGLKVASSDIIDELTYAYTLNSNKLLSVTESAAIGNTDHKLGDFTDRQSASADYAYDVNGNLLMDLNKQIYGSNAGGNYSAGITYNHLNLPWKIQAHPSGGQGSVTYIYDAVGNKLEKLVHEDVSASNSQVKDNTTTYIGGFVYENNKLQFLAHEEGRIRMDIGWKTIGCTEGAEPYPCDPVPPIWRTDSWYDYFIKDHLGNVRMMLTEENKTDIYQATMEPGKRDFEVALFGDKVNSTAY